MVATRSIILPSQLTFNSLGDSVAQSLLFRCISEGRIPVASIGDSIANYSGFSSNFNNRVCATGYSGEQAKPAAWYGVKSQGWLRTVANCGVSGENSTQLLARDAVNPPTATRKAIKDAADCGAVIAVVSILINDIQQNVSAATSQASIDAFLTGTAYPQLQTVLRRIWQNGMIPVFRSLSGYDYGSFQIGLGATSADCAARRAVAIQANSYIKDTLIPGLIAEGMLAIYADVWSVLCNADGTYKTGMTFDGLHPSNRGARTDAGAIVSTLQSCGLLPAFPLPSLVLNGRRSINVWRYPSMTATGGNGVLDCTSVAAAIGSTCTITKTQRVYNGRYWQEAVVTPTVAGTGGLAGVQIDFLLRIIGASPDVSVTAGQLLLADADIIIDDGNGGVAVDIVSSVARLRMWYAAGASNVYCDDVAYDTATSNQMAPDAAIKERRVIGPLAIPDASVNLTDAKLSFIVLSKNLSAFRVLVAVNRVSVATSDY